METNKVTTTVDSNKAIIRGTIVENPVLFMTTKKDEYYMVKASVKRLSGSDDIVPIVFPRKSIDPNADYKTLRIDVEGQLQSIRKDGHLLLYVFAQVGEIYEAYEEVNDVNSIEFVGVMKKKTIRETALQKIKIADVTFLNRKNYYPCIAWNKEANIVEDAEGNTKMAVKARFQSREYNKQLEDGEIEKRMAYEISIYKLDVLTPVQSERKTVAKIGS